MEHTYSRETDARLARRTLIEAGHPVSLLSFDSSRDIHGLYVFDSYEREEEEPLNQLIVYKEESPRLSGRGTKAGNDF